LIGTEIMPSAWSRPSSNQLQQPHAPRQVCGVCVVAKAGGTGRVPIDKVEGFVKGRDVLSGE
jgi:hypothetical protein